MAVPNLIGLLGLSFAVFRDTREYYPAAQPGPARGRRGAGRAAPPPRAVP